MNSMQRIKAITEGKQGEETAEAAAEKSED